MMLMKECHLAKMLRSRAKPTNLKELTFTHQNLNKVQKPLNGQETKHTKKNTVFSKSKMN